MEYRKATEQDTAQIYNLVQTTITTIYPRYYPKEVVDFFCALHNEEAIRGDILAGNAGVLLAEGRIVGTGSYQGNHITRVYVLPKFQGKGYGSFIMEQLEMLIGAAYEKAVLDASLPACNLYEKRGYKTVKHAKWNVENGVVLVYEIMEKEFHTIPTTYGYGGKCFVPKVNSENGEVDGQTIFHYHQNESLNLQGEMIHIKKCTTDDIHNLAVLNKQLIDDEKSQNPMNIKELEERMKGFLDTEYNAYYFIVENETVGYALVKNNCTPLYLRQFLIDRQYRKHYYGTRAFQALLQHLNVKAIDIEVLSWNEAGKRFWENCGFQEISRYMRYKE